MWGNVKSPCLVGEGLQFRQEVLFFSDVGGTAGDEGQRSWFLPVFLDMALAPRGVGGLRLRWLLEVVRQLHAGLGRERLGLYSLHLGIQLAGLRSIQSSFLLMLLLLSILPLKSLLYACMVYFDKGLN